MAYVLSSEEKSMSELIELAPKVADYLEGESDEIKEASVMPDSSFQIEIKLDAEKLNDEGLTLQAVKTALENNLTILPGGNITQDDITKQISINKTITTLDDIKTLTINSNTTLEEVANINRVNTASEEEITMAAYLDDKGKPTFSDEAVYLMVMKKDDGDVIRLREDMDTALAGIYDKNIIPKDVKVNLTYDTSSYVSDSINSLVENGLIGLLAIVLVFLFFIDFRTGIVVSLIIPLAFFITFFVLKQIGYTLNILVLFSLILTLGILVDNAIVIAEGILHRIQYEGKKRLEASIEAIRDLGPAVTAATATTIVVFIPFAMLGGFMGEILKYIPITVIIMLIVSYFLAISITPLLARFILKQETAAEKKKKKRPAWNIIYHAQRSIDGLVGIYDKVMTYIHPRRWMKALVILLVIIGLGFSFYLPASEKISTSQFPVTDSEQFSVTIEYPKGVDLETEKEITSKILQEVIEVPYFEGSLVWMDQIMVLITEPAKRSDDPDTTVYTIVADLEEEVEIIKAGAPEGTKISVGAQSYGPPGSEFDLILEVKSDNDEILTNTLNEVDKFIKNSDYQVKTIENELTDNLVPSIEINFDQEKIEDYGITPLTTSAIINSVFSDSKIGKITLREDGIQDDIIISYDQESTNSIEDLEEILVPQAAGFPVELSEIAEIKSVNKAESIQYINGERSVSYKVALDAPEKERSKLSAELQADLEKYFDDSKLAALELNDESLSFGGFAAELESDFENLIIVFIIAVIAVLIILIFQFNSYTQPILIMVAVPVALIGVFPGLYLVGSSIDMISGLGIIALVGIVVNDAIVFVDYYNRTRRLNPKWTLSKSLIYTGKVRLKPILSTSITTIAGILPLTIVDVFWRGLGTALVSGLIFATLGNLIVLPILISFIDCFAGKCKRKVKRK